MTLPAAFPLSMSQVATELGLSLPLSLSHAWVEALARKTALPVSFSDLLGKTGRFDGNLTVNLTDGSTYAEIDTSLSFFNISITAIYSSNANGGQLGIFATGTPPASISKVLLKNNTTGASAVLGPPISGQAWTATGVSNWNNIVRTSHITDNFTILPST